MKKLIISIAIMAITISSAHASRIGFGSDVGSGWGKGRIWLKSMEFGFKPHGLKIVNAKDGHPVRLGKKSIRFEVRPGDCGHDDSWSDCENDRERHELSQKKSRHRHGDEYYYSWSIFIPEDTPSIIPTKVHLGQFHQKNNNVLWLFSWRSSGYMIDNQVPGKGWTRESQTIIDSENFKGKWHDILVHVKWSHNKDGMFKIYANGKLRYDWKGQTIAKGDQSYYKFGIYRSFLSRYKSYKQVDKVPTQVVYYDAVNRGKQLHKVDLAGVARLQEILKSKGHYDGVVDGLWGRNTLKGTNALLKDMGEEPVKTYSLDLWETISKAE